MKNEEKLMELLGALCEKLDKLITLLEPDWPYKPPPPRPNLGATVTPLYGVRVPPKRELGEKGKGL